MSPSKKSPCSSRLEDEKQDDAGGKVGCGGGVVVGGGGGGGGGGDPPPEVLGHSLDPVVESIQLLTAGSPRLVNDVINFYNNHEAYQRHLHILLGGLHLHSHFPRK